LVSQFQLTLAQFARLLGKRQRVKVGRVTPCAPAR
jgi:hypothetical protein